MTTLETKNKKNIPICVFTNKQYADIKKGFKHAKKCKNNTIKKPCCITYINKGI